MVLFCWTYFGLLFLKLYWSFYYISLIGTLREWRLGTAVSVRLAPVNFEHTQLSHSYEGKNTCQHSAYFMDHWVLVLIHTTAFSLLILQVLNFHFNKKWNLRILVVIDCSAHDLQVWAYAFIIELTDSYKMTKENENLMILLDLIYQARKYTTYIFVA